MVTRQSRGLIAFTAAIVTIIGVGTGNVIWVIFGTIAAIIIGLSEAWWRWGAVGLEYRRMLSSPSATCGDTLSCVVEITNRKALPMPWVDTNDDWPSVLLPERARRRLGWGGFSTKADLTADGAEGQAQAFGATTGRHSPPAMGSGTAPTPIPQQTDRDSLTQRLTLAPFEQVRRTFSLHCTRRGAYSFGPVAIRWRDAFGLTARDADLDLRSTLIVYPRTVPVVVPPILARQLLGDRLQPRALLTDPTRLAGVRPYVAGDSVRRMHWGASARTGTLQVRRDDPTAGRRLWIVVDVETAPEERWWSAGDTDAHETVVLVAAGLAKWALQNGVAVGITANGRSAGNVGDLHVQCIAHRQHLVTVLDALARLRPWPSRLLRDSIDATAHRWPSGSSTVLLTAMPSLTKAAAIQRATNRRTAPVVVDCSSNAQVRPTVGKTAGLHEWRLIDATEPWQTRSLVSFETPYVQ